MKESAEWIDKKTLIHQHRVYCREVTLQRGSLVRELLTDLG
jgi:hypothetical protein